MINKIHNRGTGSGSGPVEYLLGKDGNREDATLLRGDPEMTINLIDSSKYQKKYTSGVLSFAETNITKDQKQEIMDSFEIATFPGLEHDQYKILWVEHLDKDRLELNYVIPNLELSTGKRLQPYYHKADGHRMNTWQNIINDNFLFSDPHDPANKQIVKRDIVRDKETREITQAINNGLYKMAEKGVVSNRSEVISALESAGFEIARTTKKSISIKNPSKNRNIRLKGYLYEQDFRLGEGVREEHGRIHAEFKENRKQRLQSNRSILKEAIERKREFHRERYAKPREFSQISYGKNIESVRVKSFGNDLSSIDNCNFANGLIARTDIPPIGGANEPVQNNRTRENEAVITKESGGVRRKENERSGSDNREWIYLHNNSRKEKNKGSGNIRRNGHIRSDRRGELSNDRDRESLVRSIERITSNLRLASKKLGGKLQQFANDVYSYEKQQRRNQKNIRDHIERQHKIVEVSVRGQHAHKNRDNEIGKTADVIQRKTGEIREIKQQTRSRSFGFSR